MNTYDRAPKVIEGLSSDVEMDARTSDLLKKIAFYMFHRGSLGKHHLAVPLRSGDYQYTIEPMAFLEVVTKVPYLHGIRGVKLAIDSCQLFLHWAYMYEKMCRDDSPMEYMVIRDFAAELYNHVMDFLVPRHRALKRLFIEEASRKTLNRNQLQDLLGHFYILEKCYFNGSMNPFMKTMMPYSEILQQIAQLSQMLAIHFERMEVSELKRIQQIRLRPS